MIFTHPFLRKEKKRKREKKRILLHNFPLLLALFQMETQQETLNACEIPGSQPYIEVVLALPAPTTGSGDRSRQAPTRASASKQQGRPRKYPWIPFMSAIPMMPLPEVASPAAGIQSRDGRFAADASPVEFVMPLAASDTYAPMEPIGESSNARKSTMPPACIPSSRVEMSMTKLQDGTCVYRQVAPTAPAAPVTRPADRNKLSMASGMKNQGMLGRYSPYKATANAMAPLSSPAMVMRSGDDGFINGDAPVGTSTPFAWTNALGFKQNCFSPYVMNVKAGQDILSVMHSVCKQEHVCIISAKGMVAQAALQQPAVSGSLVNYEGRYEILSLSGMLTERNSKGSTGELHVLLAGLNGRVYGGRPAGILIAASPVEVIVRNFKVDGC